MSLAQLCPGKLGRRPGADHQDLTTVDDQDVVFGLVRSRLLGVDRTRKTTLGGVVLKKVGQVVRGHDIADGDHVKGRAEQALLHKGAEDKAADATKPVDCDFNCHGFLRFYCSCSVLRQDQLRRCAASDGVKASDPALARAIGAPTPPSTDHSPRPAPRGSPSPATRVRGRPSEQSVRGQPAAATEPGPRHPTGSPRLAPSD